MNTNSPPTGARDTVEQRVYRTRQMATSHVFKTCGLLQHPAVQRTRMVIMNESLNEVDAGGMEYSLWLAKVGLSRPTGYRYRRDKKIVTYNLEGREFILTEEIVRFWQRVKAGEFAKKPRGASARARRASSLLPGHAQGQDGHTSAKSTCPRPDDPPSGQ